MKIVQLVYDVILLFGAISAILGVSMQLISFLDRRPKFGRIIWYLDKNKLVLNIEILPGVSSCTIEDISVKGFKVALQKPDSKGTIISPNEITDYYRVIFPEDECFSDSVKLDWYFPRNFSGSKRVLIVCKPSNKTPEKLRISSRIWHNFSISKTIPIDVNIRPTETQINPK